MIGLLVIKRNRILLGGGGAVMYMDISSASITCSMLSGGRDDVGLAPVTVARRWMPSRVLGKMRRTLAGEAPPTSTPTSSAPSSTPSTSRPMPPPPPPPPPPAAADAELAEAGDADDAAPP